jgi:diguanylate cyclase (GGDEF)-like protein
MMDRHIRVLLVSQDRGLRHNVQGVCSGVGDPGVERAHRDLTERLQALNGGTGKAQADNGWRLEVARSIDMATDMLEAPGATNAGAFIVILDCDWEYQENVLLFTLTLQAISDQAFILFLGTQPEGQLRGLVQELGDLDRVSFLRKPLEQEELGRAMTNLAWRGIVAHNLKQSEAKGFSGVGAAELAGALLMEGQAEQRRMAVQDTLTGLGNRRLYEAALGDLFKLDPARRRHALMLIDLDKFKAVNDTLGHAAGDDLLRQVADRLRELAGPDDVIIRLGGDEFALIHPSTDNAQELAEAIVASLCEPFSVESQNVQIGASIGWASVADEVKDPAELSARADTALYSVKAEGRGAAKRYTRDQDRQRLAREALEKEMKERIKSDAAPILFSPIADATTGAISAAEGILDLTGDGLADITETRLEALMANAQLAVEVAFWTVTSVIAQAAKAGALQISFNVTPRLLKHEHTARRLGEVIEAMKIDPLRLVAEVPSAAVFSDPDVGSARIKALRALGIGVVLDDFGIGSFSIDALVRMQATGAKIAPEYAHAAVASAQSAQIMRGLTQVGAGAGLHLIASGVDTGAQWLAMNTFRCHHVQGRAISSPMALDALMVRVGASTMRDAGNGTLDRLKGTSVR